MSTAPNQLSEQEQSVICIMSFADYDDSMRKATETEMYGSVPNWPSLADIEEMSSQLSVEYLALKFSWLLEMNPDPNTDDEKASFAAMKRFTYEHLKLVDSVEKPELCVMTFAEYDDFMQRATEIELYGLRPYWPSSLDIDTKGSQFSVRELTLMFSWLLEMNPEPNTEAEKLSYNAMKQYVYEHLELVDDSVKA